ncbi:Cys-every-fifth RiPP peptide CefA [Actinomycetospora sp. C-140]
MELRGPALRDRVRADRRVRARVRLGRGPRRRPQALAAARRSRQGPRQAARRPRPDAARDPDRRRERRDVGAVAGLPARPDQPGGGCRAVPAGRPRRRPATPDADRPCTGALSADRCADGDPDQDTDRGTDRGTGRTGPGPLGSGHRSLHPGPRPRSPTDGCRADGCGADGCGADGCGADGCGADGCGAGWCGTEWRVPGARRDGDDGCDGDDRRRPLPWWSRAGPGTATAPALAHTAGTAASGPSRSSGYAARRHRPARTRCGPAPPGSAARGADVARARRPVGARPGAVVLREPGSRAGIRRTDAAAGPALPDRGGPRPAVDDGRGQARRRAVGPALTPRPGPSRC